MKPDPGQLEQMLREEMTARGAVSFARFMALALECPLLGFYEQEQDSPGRRGHFFTSVSVGPLFGHLLAFQFAAWLEPLAAARQVAAATPLRIVEAGAHDGRLAADILGWLRAHRPALWEQVEYAIVEPSARRRRWQEARLAEFGDRVRWYAELHPEESDVPPGRSAGARRALPRVTGIMFSNELLDAMPVHRFGWDARQRRWFEWGVTWRAERFEWTRLDSLPTWAESRLALPADLLRALPDGFTTEIGRAAETWWEQAARGLRAGKLLTVDYGLRAEEFFHPGRAHGTVRAYHRHQLQDQVLARPGEQDLTAHVNFTAIQHAGEAVGLHTEDFLTQAQFLTRVAARVWQRGEPWGRWTSAQVRQFQTLTHPEHLGRAFRVLIQSRP